MTHWIWTPCHSRVSPHLRTNLPPYHSDNNPLTIQAKDCARVCAQVMEADRKEAFLSTQPQPLSALSPHKQCPTNRHDPAESWDAVDTVSCGLWSYCSHLWSQLESYVQTHTWEGWVAFLRNELHQFLRLKAGFLSAAKIQRSNHRLPPKQTLAVVSSLGISTHVFTSLIPLFLCFQREKMTYFIPNQEIIVIVRLNHTRQVC